MRRIALANAVAAVLGAASANAQFHDQVIGSGEIRTGHIALANDSLLTQSAFNTQLTEYAIGFSRSAKLRELIQHLAPLRVRTSRKVTLDSYVNADAFQNVPYAKVKRAINADFAEVPPPTWNKSTVTLENRGLMICIDADEAKERPQYEQQVTQWLIDILMRAEVDETVALLSAAASNVNKTWDATTNPDYDVKNQAITAANLMGFRPNSAIYGDAAELLRQFAYEAAARANGAGAGAALNGNLAQRIGVDRLLVNAERYSSSSTARTEFIGSAVYLFSATDGEQMIDSSNFTRVVSTATTFGGGDYAVYVYDPSPKRRIVMVENYSKIHTQHVLGLRKLTVS